MKLVNHPAKAVDNCANSTIQRVSQPAKVIVDNRPQVVAQRRLQQAATSRSNTIAQRRRLPAVSPVQKVIQPKWTLNEVLKVLRNSDAGTEALLRMKNNKIAISHQSQNGTFIKTEAVNGKLEDRQKPSGMDGFGESKIIYISDEVDVSHAAAMIVHETTHSVQKLPGGFVHDWIQEKDPSKKADRVEIELKMELEAHLNQFEFELETKQLSDKCRQCLDVSGTKIDDAKVRAMVEKIYEVGAVPTPLEQQAIDENRVRRSKMLKDFKDPTNNMNKYDWDKDVAPLLVDLQKNDPIPQDVVDRRRKKRLAKSAQAAVPSIP